MEIPKYIKESIKKSARHNAIATTENTKIREWLYKNNIYNDGNVDALIDSIEVENDPQGLIDHLENTCFEGNSKCYEGDFD